MPQPYKVFVIYAREDAAYLKELRGQLRPLELAGRIQVWSDKEINPGQDWEQEIVHNLDTADIILILVSAAYYDSAYIHDKEIKYAIKRHDRGEAKVLPIIVRPCSFLDDPIISRLQVLPTDGKPVTDRRHWQERDDAWLDVVGGLKQTLELMVAAENRKQQETQQTIDREKEQKQRAQEQALHEAQLKKEKEERQRLEQIRRQEDEKRRSRDQTLWNLSVETHTIAGYQTYLDQFPDGLMAHEARAAIKALKKEAAAPLPLKKYLTIGGGALLLLLAFWGLPKLVSSGRNSAQNDSQTMLSENKKEVPKAKSGLEMVPVPGGSFFMGSPVTEKDRVDDECQHVVTVKPFSIGKYEVTQADWRAVMGNNPSYHQNCDDCPVEQVSWNDIQECLKKLNARFPGKNYRLPTEAEWEYAARGAGVGNYLVYSGSNNLEDVGWFKDNSSGQTQPVGGKQSNRLGLCDLSGNVWEWCLDLDKNYPCNNRDAETGRYHVCRGGSATDNRGRNADRLFQSPTRREDYLGFRLVSVSLQ